MKKSMIRTLSLFLAILMALSGSPVAYAAADPTVPEETVETTEIYTEPTEETAVWTETMAGTEPDMTEAATVCTEVTGETLPVETEPVQTVPEETLPPETVPGDSPVLSESQLAEKQMLAESGILSALQTLIPGEGYGEKEILVRAEDMQTAQQIAEAFGGEVERMSHGIALIRLADQTALEAIAASVDPEIPLPGAYPNFYYKARPRGASSHAANGEQPDLPQKRDWSYWVQECDIDDPFLQEPNSTDYQWMHDAVNTYAAWGVTTGEPWVKVAVLDTGVQENHPDLAGKVESYNIGCGTSDCDGHGTHVAGIIAASLDNRCGGAGIAPGVTIMNIRVFRTAERAESFDITCGIEEAVAQGAWIINMSLGSLIQSSLEAEAIAEAIDSGVTVVAAMGNNGSNSVHYPAAVDGVIGVTAVDRSDERAWFSNYGDWADVAAPGVDIMSSVSNSRYGYKSGTSMASPVVAGMAALYMSAYGHTSPKQMEKLIRAAVIPLDDKSLGTGLIDGEALFGGNKTVPDYWITGEGVSWFNNYNGSVIPCESTLYLMLPNYDNGGKILYTVKGRTPAVKDGTVVEGIEFTDGINLSEHAGKTVTVKAAYVSGMGIVNKVLTLKLRVAGSGHTETERIEAVRIDGPDKLVAGKSGTFTAQVDPGDAYQGVTWSVQERSDSQQRASVSSGGILRTVSGKSGYVVLQAASKEDPDVIGTIRVEIVNNKPVSVITLNRTAMTLRTGESGSLWASSILDTDGNSVSQEEYGVAWSSSNSKIARVDSEGIVYGCAKGTATITCKSLDGSGRTAKCRVTVTQPVESILVYGPGTISPGTTGRYKADIQPGTANNKKVVWSLQNAPEGVTVSSTGTVNVKSSVEEGQEFTVIATAADGGGTVGGYEVITAKKCTGINVYYGGTGGESRADYNSRGQMTGLTLYSAQRSDGLNSGFNTDTSAELDWEVLGTEYAAVILESSNPKVADFELVNGQAVLRAYSAGKTKVTYTANDGSGKKATVTVTVINPVSSMHVWSDSGTVFSTGNPVIAFGESAGNQVTFADTYGVPTNRKVTWSVAVKEYNAAGGLVEDWTTEALQKKLVSVSSSGRLSTRTGLETLGHGGQLRITVTAKATDGTGAKASLDYYALRPTRVLASETRNWNIWSDGWEWGVEIRCDQPLAYGQEDNCAFTVKSGNPRLVSVSEILCEDADEGIYRIWLASGRIGARGSTSLSIKSGDGCKSLTLNIRVYPR